VASGSQQGIQGWGELNGRTSEFAATHGYAEYCCASCEQEGAGVCTLQHPLTASCASFCSVAAISTAQLLLLLLLSSLLGLLLSSLSLT
jgi:hypothetical protein